MARSRNHCYHGNATVRFFFIVAGMDVALNSMKMQD